jgi:hypothetical protein
MTGAAARRDSSIINPTALLYCDSTRVAVASARTPRGTSRGLGIPGSGGRPTANRPAAASCSKMSCG